MNVNNFPFSGTVENWPRWGASPTLPLQVSACWSNHRGGGLCSVFADELAEAVPESIRTGDDGPCTSDISLRLNNIFSYFFDHDSLEHDLKALYFSQSVMNIL